MIVRDKDLGYKNLMQFFRQSGKSAEIGIFENKKDEEGRTIAEYATHNEFGTKKIPERSFMRSAYDENINEIMRVIEKATAMGCTTSRQFEQILKVAGEKIRNVIIMKIRSAKSWARPLAYSTIRAKGHDTILIHSGNMWKAIDVRIK